MMKNIFLFAVCVACFASCGGEKEVDKIGDAQLCLDKVEGSDSAAIQKCLEPIEGLTGAGAESLRCTAGFMAEDLANGNRIIQGFDQLGDSPGSDKTIAMMEILSFTSEGGSIQDFENAKSTFQSCLKSGAKAATLLSSFSYLAMSLVEYLRSAGCASVPETNGSYDFPYYDLSTCVENLDILDPVDQGKILALAELVNRNTNNASASNAQSGVGAILIAAESISCPENGSANKALCELLTNAVSSAASSDPRDVAIEFFTSSLAFPQ